MGTLGCMLCVCFLIVTHFPCLFPFTATSQQEQRTVKSFCLPVSLFLSFSLTLWYTFFISVWLGYAAHWVANMTGRCLELYLTLHTSGIPLILLYLTLNKFLLLSGFYSLGLFFLPELGIVLCISHSRIVDRTFHFSPNILKFDLCHRCLLCCCQGWKARVGWL